MNYTYLAIDLGAILVPLLASFHPLIRFYKFWSMALISMVLSGLAFILWDIGFTHAGVWGFNPAYVSGIYFFNLPVEEVLFFLCIPYACMFSYYCLQIFRPQAGFSIKISTFISWILIAIGSIAAVIFYQQKYTCATFLLLALFILFVKNKPWVGKFYFCYSLLLIPFLIVNGLLTGTMLDAPVVWYNSHEIIGVRILTIPIEDVFYGLVLIGSQVAFFEWMLGDVRLWSDVKPV
jgi:lycopene cyclase domain-containing protein